MLGMLHDLRIALRMLATFKLRTALAVLGVFLGAFILTFVLHVLQSVALQVRQEARRLGSDVITITALKANFPRKNDEEERVLAQLSREDFQAIRQSHVFLEACAPFVQDKLVVGHGETKTTSPFIATTADYPRIRNVHPARGRFFERGEDEALARVCVLGSALAQKLFPDQESPIGQYVSINTTEMKVVGVMEPKGLDGSGVNQDEQIFFPLNTFIQRINYRETISGIWLVLKTDEAAETVTRSIARLLRARHHLPWYAPDDFSIAFSRQVNQMRDQAVELVRTLGYVGSTLCFAIGSLGILSIMSLIVRSRRMEIGVRRAVGAGKKNILSQFLLEALLLSSSGGLTGVASSMALLMLLYGASGLPAVFDLPVAAGVCWISCVCGLVAGLYPAWQATRTQILDALKL